jgi:hypothetical protein
LLLSPDLLYRAAECILASVYNLLAGE